MLQDEALEYIQEQFDEKNNILGQFGEQVDAWSFYEDVFSDLELVLPVVVLDEDAGKKIRPMELSSAIEFSMCRNDVLLGGVSYFNNWISKNSAKELYTLIIDIDNVYAGTLLNALQNDWKSANGEPFAKPTYIVNSGTGIHAYFVFDESIPCYKRNLQDIDMLYRELAVQQSRRVYFNQQVQWFGQDFRMAGGQNKYGWENSVFKVGEKWDIDDLAKTVGMDVHYTRYGEPRNKVRNSQRARRRVSSGWHTNPAFYYYALENCREKTKEGHRYTSMCALTVIAWKCNIPKEELEQDLRGLLPEYNRGAVNIIREKEIYSALKMYNEKAMLTQRRSLEHWQGWEFRPAIKRNNRKQDEHLKRARAVQNIDYPDGEWRGTKKTAEPIVRAWQKKNPNGRKADCIRETKLDPKTVRKWWL